MNINYKLALLCHAPLIAERFNNLCPVLKVSGDDYHTINTRLETVCKAVCVAVRRLNIKRASNV